MASNSSSPFASMTSSRESIITDGGLAAAAASASSSVDNDDNDNTNAELIALAERLAPTFKEADILIGKALPTEEELNGSSSGSSGNNSPQIALDDDDLNDEIAALPEAVRSLHDALEHFSVDRDEMKDPGSILVQQLFPVEEKTNGNNRVEPDVLQDDNVDVDEATTTNGRLDPIRIPTPRRTATQQRNPHQSATITTPRATTTPSNDTDGGSTTALGCSDPRALLVSTPPGQRFSTPYRNSDHLEALELRKEEGGGWYTVDMTAILSMYGGRHARNSDATADENSVSDDKKVDPPPDDEAPTMSPIPPGSGIKEYCLALPLEKLNRLYVGLPEQQPPPRRPQQLSSSPARTSGAASASAPPGPPLPIRTLAMRIRPDVLCGAVMDAVANTFNNMEHARIRKRQGGHLRAVVGGAVFYPQTETEAIVAAGNAPDESASESASNVIRYPPYFVDAQLCTCKTDDCERALLVRVYHLSDFAGEDGGANTDDLVTLRQMPESSPGSAPGEVDDDVVIVSHHETLSKPIDVRTALRLRECCALVQRMESPLPNTRKIRPLSHLNTPEAVQQAVSYHLLEHYRAMPSVKEGLITLPALNPDDWPVIKSSSRVIHEVWEELENRDLTFTTLTSGSSRFGSFPALLTLDNQYCSQIRKKARESMIVQLLKAASDLEEYGREAEYTCANLISLLKPTFEAYGVDAPPLPKPVPLTEYPLEFTPPQLSCPPWGLRVTEALNEVQAWTGKANAEKPHLVFDFGLATGDGAGDSDALRKTDSTRAVETRESVEMSNRAVQLVFTAFQKQDDEEQSARLGRKNIQVMDRLAKMKAHEELCVQTLQGCLHESEKARRAADDFLAKAGVREVPLLKWSVAVGSSTGTCCVTANYVLFVTQLIPVIGGNRIRLFPVRDVDFALQEASPSLLNPLPTVISIIRDGREVYSFRPAMGGPRLKSFLDAIKRIATDNSLNWNA